ncbi:flagellar hook-associated protein FlgL [Clostridium sp.]|uniref:flagellar hook-associated protein FlgL n=1 Tax=Clostridium sp. TaxID=1506 RepID=UPI0009678DA4|nr:flagellar hook-associated protein FlgL [Clostridium sp.]MEE0566541.1 flagellar hook-associated protein FlgL [Clostridium sp.]OKZ78029.1 MAG: flagellar hook-associated protein 3 [Clostridium sp. 27_14]
MRVTNQMMSTSYLKDLNRNLNNLNTLQTQLTTGKEINKASDNPFKTARIMQMYSDISANKQYNENIKDTISWLDTTDTALNQLGSTSQRIRELMVSSGNAIYGSDEKKAIKNEINQLINQTAQILNTNFDGKYIFGGTKSLSKPVGVEKDSNGNNILVFKDADGNSFNEEGKAYIKNTDGTIERDANGNLKVEANSKPEYENLLKQMKSSLSVEVSNGVNMDYNVCAPNILISKKGTNAMKLLNDVVNNLDKENSSEVLNNNLADMDLFIANINNIRGEVGSKQNRMETAKTQNEDQNSSMKEILSKTEDVDMAEKTIELATLQSVYVASLQVSAAIIQKSLVDFI